MNVRTEKKWLMGLFWKKKIVASKIDYELGENNVEIRYIQGDKN